MASLPLETPPGFDRLSREQQLEYIEVLCSRLRPPEESDRRLTPEQEAELLRRRESYRANPDLAEPWPEARAELVGE